MALDSLVPATIDADVTDGYVTLTGKAEWQYQRDEADDGPAVTAATSTTAPFTWLLARSIAAWAVVQ